MPQKGWLFQITGNSSVCSIAQLRHASSKRNLKTPHYWPFVSGIHWCHLASIGIPMLKIRRSHDRLIFNMGIPIPGKDGRHIEMGPSNLESTSMSWPHYVFSKCVSSLLPHMCQLILFKQYLYQIINYTHDAINWNNFVESRLSIKNMFDGMMGFWESRKSLDGISQG